MSRKKRLPQKTKAADKSHSNKLAVNAADSIRERFQAFVSGGYDFADTLHDVYLDFGYPADLDFFNFWNMYRRFGIAKNVVETYPELGWMESPTVKADASVLRDIEALNEKLGLWTRIKGLDTRQRVGRYAGLFMRVRDGLSPSESIGSLSGLNSLVDMIPLYESQLEIVDTEDNIMSDEYGKPTMYQFRGGDVGNRNENNVDSFNIHPSRIIIAAEGSDNGSVYGVSSLEAVYNSLMDLRKIIGAGGEGFYKNAAQSIIYKLDADAGITLDPEAAAEFNERSDDFLRNRPRRSNVVAGMDAKVLESSLANPKDFFMNALNDVASGAKIPATILMGQQTGRLASDQDSAALLSRVQSRRVHFQTEITGKVLDWLMANSILPKGEYVIEWPDALAASSEEKLANSDLMASINQKMFLSGGGAPFTAEEIREAAGFEPGEIEDLPDESLDDEDA
jgi:hypothetical protein